MKSEIKLEQYYSGDEGWEALVEIAKREFNASRAFKKALLKQLNRHLGIAVVIHYRLGDDSLNWLHRKVPALDGLTPLGCLATPDLIKRLKVCLMRMP